MTWFQLLLFLHIMAAVVWIGGALAGMLIGTQMRKAGETIPFARFCTAFAQVAGPLFGGSAILVLLTGVGMVTNAEYIEFSAPWISIGLAGWLVSMVMGATVVGGTWTKIGRELQQDGATLDATQPLITKAVRLTWIDLLVRIAVVLVMVWQPS